MIIVKMLVSLMLFIPYLCSFGTLTFSCDFPDGTHITYNGWLF